MLVSDFKECMTNVLFATWKFSFPQSGIWSTKGKGAAKKVEELPVKRFTSGLREGKHSGIRIGHEQQEFRSKKSAIKRLQYN